MSKVEVRFTVENTIKGPVDSWLVFSIMKRKKGLHRKDLPATHKLCHVELFFSPSWVDRKDIRETVDEFNQLLAESEVWPNATEPSALSLNQNHVLADFIDERPTMVPENEEVLEFHPSSAKSSVFLIERCFKIRLDRENSHISTKSYRLEFVIEYSVRTPPDETQFNLELLLSMNRARDFQVKLPKYFAVSTKNGILDIPDSIGSFDHFLI